MKKFTKAIACGLALLTCLSFPIGVSAASVADATIDFDRKGSLTLYKLDLSNAEKDGVWDSSYIVVEPSAFSTKSILALVGTMPII